ncbi:LppM family (lipo)protein [Demequina sp.]|uniref:LppM family (lipo)protein n=1 Tax=Demequina sp. TaxID=2050685 RepID=UPI003D0CA052
MKNAAKVAALSLLVVLTLAGCFKGKVDLTLNSDNTIDGSMVMAIQKGLGDTLGMSDEDILAEMTGDLGDDFDGAKVEDYVEEGTDGEAGFIGKKVTFENQPLDKFQSDEDGSDISITREGDLFIVDGTWDTEDATGDTEGMDPGTLGASFTFSVTFPGEVTDSNGTVEGNTVTWDLLDPPATMHAEGKATAGGNFPWGLLVIALGVLIIAAVVVMIVVRSRGKKQPDPELEPAAAVPAVAYDPASAAPVVEPEPVVEAPAEGESAPEDPAAR